MAFPRNGAHFDVGDRLVKTFDQRRERLTRHVMADDPGESITVTGLERKGCTDGEVVQDPAFHQPLGTHQA